MKVAQQCLNAIKNLQAASSLAGAPVTLRAVGLGGLAAISAMVLTGSIVQFASKNDEARGGFENAFAASESSMGVNAEVANARLNFAIHELAQGLSLAAWSNPGNGAAAAISEVKGLSECADVEDPSEKISCLSDVVQEMNENAQDLAAQVPQFIPPTYGLITSGYGHRESPFGDETSNFHDGVDIAAPKNSVFVAPADGQITAVEHRKGYGALVTIQHQGGFESRFAHVGGLFIKVGQMVNRGQPLGVVGMSGRTTGPHLHYEMLRNGQLIDPKPYVDLPTIEEMRQVLASNTKKGRVL